MCSLAVDSFESAKSRATTAMEAAKLQPDLFYFLFGILRGREKRKLFENQVEEAGNKRASKMFLEGRTSDVDSPIRLTVNIKIWF